MSTYRYQKKRWPKVFILPGNFYWTFMTTMRNCTQHIQTKQQTYTVLVMALSAKSLNYTPFTWIKISDFNTGRIQIRPVLNLSHVDFKVGRTRVKTMVKPCSGGGFDVHKVGRTRFSKWRKEGELGPMKK